MKTKKDKKKVKSKGKLEKSLRSKMSDFIKSLGHDVKDIASDLKGVSKLLADKLTAGVKGKKKSKKDKKEGKSKKENDKKIESATPIKVIESVDSKHIKPIQGEENTKQVAPNKTQNASATSKITPIKKKPKQAESAITSVPSVNQTVKADVSKEPVQPAAKKTTTAKPTGNSVKTTRPTPAKSTSGTTSTPASKASTADNKSLEKKPAPVRKKTVAAAGSVKTTVKKTEEDKTKTVTAPEKKSDSNTETKGI
ncbi:hypothetical protein [Pseudopedobacter sp.]|uniref:hypothetical protein n=1 Tax=Pseudopedobacter sp. TaxID=1936787 RepID=UPI003341311F